MRVKIFYTKERIADIWACELWNETLLSKTFLYKEAKNLWT